MILRYSDESLIDGLRRKSSACITYMYKVYCPLVSRLVKINSGSEQDMEDLFQDAIIILYKRTLEEPFILTCSLKTYFLSICKFLWLQRLERKSRLQYSDDLQVDEPWTAYFIEDLAQSEVILEQRRLFYKNLLTLPIDCQRLIKLYCLKISYKEIARMLKIKDEVSVKTRKYLCKSMLRKKIMKDPECKKYLQYEGLCNDQRLD
ncbi:MAG: sigma-70 family RNA polymerase sigma factor [Bacteroidota bacterium]